MPTLVHELITHSAARSPDAEALRYQGQSFNYRQLSEQVTAFAHSLFGLDVRAGDRVGVYLDKRFETVVAMFGASAAGAVFVPINPLLKAEQVAYILRDCNVKVLVTTTERALASSTVLAECADLRAVVIIGKQLPELSTQVQQVLWQELSSDSSPEVVSRQETDIAAILYTSGSTGKPKGVVLSHRNLLTGARSVSHYLQNTSEDKLLAVLPLSFDYGLSQLTTAFYVGATVVLFNYLFPRDIVKAVVDEGITGLAAVPPLWIQLAQLSWPQPNTLRYLTNSGGAMQGATLQALRQQLPHAQIYLMYGLTEAFRSTYLPPEQLDQRPDSIGKAIPSAEVLVLRPDGTVCDDHEAGELVHRGDLVALGYWNDAEKTSERFKPLPASLAKEPNEIAVWSGDTVRRDEEGFLYFIGRTDDMIKVSGYRISPTEVEEALSSFAAIHEVIAFGVPHPAWGQAIVAVALPHIGAVLDIEALRKECQRRLPAYMVPSHIEIATEPLPRNPNGKIDRRLWQQRLNELFNDV